MSKTNSYRKYEINYKRLPEDISLSELDNIFSETTCFYIEELLASKRTWYVMYQYMVWFSMYAMSSGDLVYRTVFIAKRDDPSFKPVQIPVIKLMMNMILWYPFMIFDSVDIIDENKILLKPYAFTSDFLRDWSNDNVVDVEGANRIEKSYILDEMYYHIASLAATFDDIIGCGISIRTFYDINKQNPMLNEILHDVIDANMQPHDIEAKIKANTAAIVDIVCNTDNELITLMKSGNLISPAQFGEVMVAIGFKSDLDGNTIPVAALSNILITGINNAMDMYIDSVGGRLALIRSKLDMAGPGAHAKKLVNNCADIKLRDDNVMCDSTAGVHYTIKDEEYLIRLNGRYYYDENGEMKCLDAKKDTNLIGKTLKFRSPETCTSPNNTVCRYCYGKLAAVNDGCASIGAYAATISTEPLGQMVLSTKHHNGTRSTEINLVEDYSRDFELRSTSICMMNSDTNAAYIDIPNIIKDETSDEDYTKYACMSFNVLDEDKKLLYTVYDKNNAKLFLDDSLSPMIRAKKVTDRNSLLIDMDSIESDCPLFTVEVASAQMTDPSKIIKQLTATKDKCGCRTLDQINDRLGSEYIKVGIKHDFVHNEVIIKSLLRKNSDLYAYPDFGPNGDHEDYRILSVNDALYYNKSPLNCMRAANLKKQLIDPGLYSANKRSPSHIDAMFAEKLSDILPDKYLEEEGE